MASSIFFNGQRIVVPQAVSRVDASALQAVSPSPTGIVALVGTAEGGPPLTVDTQYDLTNPDAAREQYRSGNLKTAALFCFEPSQDEAIPGGAQQIVPVKVNPSTQSTATLPDDNAVASVDLTSADWGLFTSQVNVDVNAGTTIGKQIVITFEGTVETIDDVGGESILSVIYAPGADGYSTITGRITAGAFTAAATKAEAGLVAERSADIAAPGTLQYVSSSVADTAQTVTVYGLNGATPVVETVTLNGTTVVNGTATFSSVLGVRKSAATTGTITVQSTVPTTLFSLAPATLTRGLVVGTNLHVADAVLTVSIDVNAAVDVLVIGVNAAGATVMERFDMTAGTTPVTGVVPFRTIQYIALGDVAGARTITLACNAVVASTSVFTTVRRLADRLNQLSGFTANALATDAEVLRVADADYAPAVSLLATANFFANLYRFISAINANSQFVTAARNAAGVAVPANTPAPVYLSGGAEGTATITEWTQAFSLLRKRRVNVIVPLTRDPAVHALLLTHLRSREGKSEANGYVGLGTSGGAGETLANIRSQIQTLNTRHISAISQEVKRFDPDTGEETWYPPHMLAAIAAGMQAGSAVGEPLTRKLIFALDLRNDSSWSVEDDITQMIDSGAMVAEKVDQIGIRWVRSITTYLADNNLAFTEMSANESANIFAYNFRRALDRKVGNRGLANSATLIKSLAAGELEAAKRDQVIADYRIKTLRVEQIGDVYPVSVEVAPIIPINFIPITIHLVPLRAAA